MRAWVIDLWPGLVLYSQNTHFIFVQSNIDEINRSICFLLVVLLLVLDLGFHFQIQHGKGLLCFPTDSSIPRFLLGAHETQGNFLVDRFERQDVGSFCFNQGHNHPASFTCSTPPHHSIFTVSPTYCNHLFSCACMSL